MRNPSVLVRDPVDVRKQKSSESLVKRYVCNVSIGPWGLYFSK